MKRSIKRDMDMYIPKNIQYPTQDLIQNLSPISLIYQSSSHLKHFMLQSIHKHLDINKRKRSLSSHNLDLTSPFVSRYAYSLFNLISFIILKISFKIFPIKKFPFFGNDVQTELFSMLEFKVGNKISAFIQQNLTILFDTYFLSLLPQRIFNIFIYSNM